MENQDQSDTQQDSDSQDIVTQLQQYSSDGLSFEAAKVKLVSQGYSDEAINLATDDYQYGSKQVSDIPAQITEYYQAHPDQSVTAGDNLLKAKSKEEAADAPSNQAILDATAADVAGRFGVQGIDVQVEYESKFASDVGISFWLLMALGFIIVGVAVLLTDLFHLYGWFYPIEGVLSLALTVYLIMRLK